MDASTNRQLGVRPHMLHGSSRPRRIGWVKRSLPSLLGLPVSRDTPGTGKRLRWAVASTAWCLSPSEKYESQLMSLGIMTFCSGQRRGLNSRAHTQIHQPIFKQEAIDEGNDVGWMKAQSAQRAGIFPRPPRSKLQPAWHMWRLNKGPLSRHVAWCDEVTS